MIVGLLVLLAVVAAAYYLRRLALAAERIHAASERMEQRMDAVSKQGKAALRVVQRTNGHADRILERAYRHQQELNALMASDAVRWAIRHRKED